MTPPAPALLRDCRTISKGRFVDLSDRHEDLALLGSDADLGLSLGWRARLMQKSSPMVRSDWFINLPKRSDKF
jgi:hypothetical protein